MSYPNQPDQPGSGQPYPPSGQPVYGQPQQPSPQYGGVPGQYQPPADPYAQPQYGQAPPQYGQAQVPYGQPQEAPAYGAPPTFETPPPPKKKGRALKIVLMVFIGLLVLCAVGGFIFVKPILDQHPASLSTPDTVAGLTKANEPQLQALGTQMSTELQREVDLDDVAAAFYTDPAAPDKLVMLIGGTKLLLSPESELDDGFKSAGTGGMTLTDVKDVDAGELGGKARCGKASVEGIALSVCAWADYGSFAMLVFFNRELADSERLMREIRGVVLSR